MTDLITPEYGTPAPHSFSGVADILIENDMESMGDRELLITILSELRDLKMAHNEVVTKVNDVIAEFAPHIPRITELVDSVANSPVMKMFGGSKK